jgi:predicted dehydrogenase
METRHQELVRVGVVGAGHLGRIHAKLLSAREDCTVVAVCDPYEPSRRWVSEQLGIPVVDSHECLEGVVDAVVIATPTSMHHEVAKWALQRGIATFIEKPIASTVAQARELESLASLFQAPLQIGHVERFNPVWKSLVERVDPSSIRRIEARREGVYTGRSTDIGIVLDLMIHDIDLILSLVDSPIAAVYANGHCLLGQHEDLALADIHFANGVTAHLRASRVSSGTQRSMEIHCQSGENQPVWYEVDFAGSTLSSVALAEGVGRGGLEADSLGPEERSKVKDELFSRWLDRQTHKPHPGNAIAAEHDDFIRAITLGGEPMVNGSAGCYALEVATRITEQIIAQSIRNELQAGHSMQTGNADKGRMPMIPSYGERDRRRAG